MSGIAGILTSGNVSKEFLNRLFIHKPEESVIGYYTDKNIEVVQNVLKTDFNRDEEFPIIYRDKIFFIDGVIHNYRELKRHLEKKGYKFNTSGKFEIIPYLYEELGKDFFSYLNGKFAIAIWDQKNEELILGVDKNSQKGIYYAKTPEGIIFSSQIKGILNSKLISAEPNWQEVYNFLTFQFIATEDLLFKGVKKVLARSYITYKKGNIKISFYEPKIIEQRKISHEELLLDSIRRVMMEDKKTGILLSGGVDSSAVAYAALKLNEKVRTYSIGYEGSEGEGDTLLSEKIASLLDIPNTQKIIGSKSIRELDKIVWINEIPTGISLIPTHHAFGLARDKEKVLLNGTEADLIYLPHKREQYRALLKVPNLLFPKFMKKSLLARDKSEFGSKYSKIVRILASKNRYELEINLFKGLQSSDKEKILNIGNLRETSECIKKFYRKHKLTEDLHLFLFVNNIVIEKNRKQSIYNSVEVGCPLLDSRLKGKYYLSNWTDSKRPLKEFVSKKIPKQIFDRKKQGFILPFGFYRKEKDFLFSKLDSLGDRKEFNKISIEKLKKSQDSVDWLQKIIRLSFLESWFENFIEK